MKHSHTAVSRDFLLQDIVSSLTENLVYFYPKGGEKTTNPRPSLAVLENWSRAGVAQYCNVATASTAASETAATDGSNAPAAAANDDDDLVQASLKIAMENWNKQTNSLNNNNPATTTTTTTTTTREDDEQIKKDAAPTTSFSLLDQFNNNAGGRGNGGAAAAAFFAWDDVQALKPFEQIKALQSVQYLDDVLPDWQGGLQVHLQQGLLLMCCDSDSNDDDDDANNQENNKKSSLLLWDEYLELHRKWFGWSRKSNEAETAHLAIDLMVNVFQAMVATPASPFPESSLSLPAATAAAAAAATATTAAQISDENEAKLKRIMKLWWEMWMDTMIRGGAGGVGRPGGDDLRFTFIVQTIWNWIPSPPPPPPPNNAGEQLQSTAIFSERGKELSLFRKLMEIDPSATWAYAWARVIHPSRTKTSSSSSCLVLQATTQVSVLVPWIRHFLHHDDDCATTLGQQQQQNLSYSSLFICIVSLLRSILASCRVAQFPWHLFEESESSSPSSFSSLGLHRSDAILAVQKVFLQGLQLSHELQPDASDNMIRICIEGIEALLSGCHNNRDKDVCDDLVGNVDSFVAAAGKGDWRDNNGARAAIQEMLERHNLFG
jgi:hypothetical protein